MANRILLLCPEPLGHRHPAGVGIRFLELARLLNQEHFEVTLLTPDGAAVDDCRTAAMTPKAIRAAGERADVALVQGHAANDWIAHGTTIPTVVDLYDPFLIENLHYRSVDHETYAHDHATLLRSLRRGDFFLCASEAQRLFYLGMLLTLGRIHPERFDADPTLRALINIVPFGVPAPRAFPLRSDESPALLFGGIYDWYDPELAVEAVARARDSIPGLTLTFTFHPNAEITPQSAFRRVRDMVDRRGFGSFVRFEPWVAYQDRAQHYDRFVAGCLTFRPSLETDLAMRTRVFDFFWGGLPVISSSAPGTDSLIRRYDAGVIVDSTDAEAVAAAIIDLLWDPNRYHERAEGTQRFVRDHQWDRLALPLLDFVREPRMDERRTALPVDGNHLDLPPPSLLKKLRRKIGGLL